MNQRHAHTHKVVLKNGKVKLTGTHLHCKRNRHGYERVEPLEKAKAPVKAPAPVAAVATVEKKITNKRRK